jgi:cell wall-associated NlpC family hydrolase
MLSSADSSAFIPAVDDGWAILTEPPGTRDLGLPEYWSHSTDRSRRRRAVRRSRLGEVQITRMSLAVAAVALTGGVAGAAAGPGDAIAAPTTAGSLNLSRGSSGPAVVALQSALGIPPDGMFGPRTERAVKRFQRAHGLPAIGRVGPQTTAALGLEVPARQRNATVKQRGASSLPAVALSRAAARALQAKLGVQADGVIGPQTRAALKRWQAANGLAADGRATARTLQAMGLDPATARAPKAKTAPQSVAVGTGSMAAMRVALAQAGVSYRSGGTTPAGFDCSGLTMYAFKKAGVSLPRTSYAQYRVGSAIRKSQIQAGDLVFFDTAGSGASHVGIATGPNTVVSATSHGVMQHAIADSYWGSHYVGARRV